jgi:hypothetical protein
MYCSTEPLTAQAMGLTFSGLRFDAQSTPTQHVIFTRFSVNALFVGRAPLPG